MQENHTANLIPGDGEVVQAQPPKRAYSIGEWQRDFARAFAAAVPLEAVRTPARGPLLAADNDEGEPNTFARIEAEANADARAIVRHAITRETRGSGIGAEHTPVCCCGWRGSAVGEYNDYMSTELKRQEHAHLAESRAHRD